MKKRSDYLKSFLQWGVLLSIVFIVVWSALADRKVDVEAYCPFGGLQALGSFWVNGSLACSMSMVQIMAGVVLAAGVVLFSKLFCGYLCPLGTVGELLGRLGRRLGVQRDIRQGGLTDRALRVVKYVLLFWILYNTLSTSELFCKKLDPYYAVATGFRGEIVAWMTSVTLALLILGGVFVRMFWCRYICPLGALGNVFKFAPLVVAAGIAVWILQTAGVRDAWQWVLGVTLAASCAVECLTLKSRVFPLLHVVRDGQRCTSCGACDNRCPYHLPISREGRVMQVDCTLCGECISRCPTRALQVNGRRSLRHVPALLTVVLFGVALLLGSVTELPTIDEKWGDRPSGERLATYSLEGLMSVKCFGSSKALAGKLQQVKGVYGLRTFVGRHAVEILYDPRQIDTVQLRSTLFVPMQRKYRTPEPSVPQLRVLELGIEGLHDRMDMVYFGMALQQVKGIYGYTSEFDCPVRVKIFVAPDFGLDREQLCAVIEAEQLVFHTPKGDKVFPMHSEVKSYSDNGERISREEFAHRMFLEVEHLGGRFSDNLEKWGDESLHPHGIYELPYPSIEKVLVRQGVPYLKSYLSGCEGMLRIDFALDAQLRPVIRLTYAKEVLDDERIWKLLTAPRWTIRMKDGTTGESAPRMKFRTPGRTVGGND